ncbi:translation initiation factor IF-2 N-terminal domain-containing protein [Corynebacterium sp.]|uniref:translation initiation factor IF-2 N-terminal domain-containing protein n=1 Tax=Corynebacterium sp. TaxID=1720 RepID=UPI0026DB6CB7|nr:translation initiation factor IF-2 N-terminal domain-containing protein [Corynebacterium sp.]MDO5031096.1 translation initiation factor IF-2 N-terminal domain-containing protein [Corynebacterium sp.]
MRVHVLAKELGIASKELVAACAELGMKKVSQSGMTPEEIAAVLDSLAAPAKSEQQPGEQPEEQNTEQDPAEDPKLRERVRKNVINEISQIEDKVELELAKAQPVEADELSEVFKDTEFAEGEESTPPVTPMPEEASEVSEYAPIFLAPTATAPAKPTQPYSDADTEAEAEAEAESTDGSHAGSKATASESKGGRRRGSRGTSRGRGTQQEQEVEIIDEPRAIKGSTRIEAQRRRRAELREKGRVRQHLVSQAEFLARRESVERTMVVRDKQRTDGAGIITQVGVLEDDLLVEHFVTTEAHPSLIGNIYLGRVQNVLPSMEAAFIDIGQGRNGVLYAGEVNWHALGLGGRGRKIENALKSGDQILVQVAKDPIGHKGARLTTQISLAGRYLVYVPGGRSAGISRKLPVPERKRLKGILERVVPGDGGAIIRTAAENVSEEAIAGDVNRLHNLWEDITTRAEKEKASKGAKPVTLYEEPDLLVKVVRDLFNEDFTRLVVDGKRSYNTVKAYVDSMAHDLADRVERYEASEHGGGDAFEAYRIDEQLHKALSRKVWLPSGGTLVIDRTEAMTVIDVNTGKFTGSGGNLEETVTRNNLEAAEEIVRQMRLRDLGGMIVVDFIDMVLPENQELVLRRLKEALGRDRTRHQVSEVTSLGLVQMTRKRLGTGLIETFSTECEACHGRGIIIHEYPVDENQEHEHKHTEHKNSEQKGRRSRKEQRRKPQQDPQQHPAALAMHHDEEQPEKQEKSSIEELVASVVVENDEPQHGRGRGRRRATRVSEAADVEDIANIGYQAADNAAELDEVAEFRSHVPDSEVDASTREESHRERGRGRRRSTRRTRPQQKEQQKQTAAEQQKQTYEEALAEFEASPRRKRRTRGNSRSDVAPRPEDFGSEQQSAPSDEARPEPASEPTRRAGRGRRRATRRSDARRGDARQHVPEQEAAPEEQKNPVAGRGRGRRRAVRASGARAAAQPQEEASKKEQPKEQGGSQGSGRGRRRVARRRFS